MTIDKLITCITSDVMQVIKNKLVSPYNGEVTTGLWPSVMRLNQYAFAVSDKWSDTKSIVVYLKNGIEIYATLSIQYSNAIIIAKMRKVTRLSSDNSIEEILINYELKKDLKNNIIVHENLFLNNNAKPYEKYFSWALNYLIER